MPDGGMANSSTAQRRKAAFLAAMAFALLAAPSFLSAAEEAATTSRGKQLFTKHCAPCHGADGRGRGPVAVALKTAPADLTQINRKHGGKFPFMQVVGFIDGERPVAAHGSREMPIWGQIFRWRLGDYGARADIYTIARYVQSIQDDRP
jgi:mono/diheme cytochrome c family protein